MPAAFERHDLKVAAIAAQLKDRLERHEPVRLSKGGVSHFVPLPGDPRLRRPPIDISGLNEILDIDPVQQTCVAEPAVTFATLLQATLVHGLMPALVPELEGITIGGAVSGCSVESMSFRYGGFHDSCKEYELISGQGEVITCSWQASPSLLEMIHGSYGTLGILSRLTFKLVPARPYVHLEYRRFGEFDEFQREMRACCEAGDYDFIDGISHASDHHVLCLGRLVDEAPYTSNYRWLNVYYKSTRVRREDYLTTPDYCFRYDTECHWLSRSVPGLESLPLRLLAGWTLLGSTNLIAWTQRLEGLLKLKKRPDVVCDYFIPYRRLPEFYAWYARELNYYPLWLVPYKPPHPYPWINPKHMLRGGDDLLVDCAIYGLANSRPEVDYSQSLEEQTYELGGIKTLISRNHYREERFWEIYHRENYDKAKARLDPGGIFPNLYEKLGRR